MSESAVMEQRDFGLSRVVLGPAGRPITLADLPPPGTKRRSRGPHVEVPLEPIIDSEPNSALPFGWIRHRIDKLSTFYAGNMAYMTPDANLFPATVPNDGKVDAYIYRSDHTRAKGFGAMLSAGNDDRFFHHPAIEYYKLDGYRFEPREQEGGTISVDGERMPFGAFSVGTHHEAGLTLGLHPCRYQAKGPRVLPPSGS